MGECFICDKHAGHLQVSGACIFEDEYIYISHIDKQGKPTYLGHIMLDLKRHVSQIGDMSEKEAAAFGIAMKRAAQGLQEVLQAEHVYTLVSGNAVSHVHMHIIPRYVGTPEEFWGPLEVHAWPDAPFGSEVEIKHVTEKLQGFMKGDAHA
ncbi:Diadenosine tetraphosphate (Ap4A) hydrolase [Terribacillus halophilus]|uniref:Diadenosine tetraphosphate (Ap4A) hydrolase n=1 Tax=Terribacillus halophilus TaxID=361279 RepID=A0A1G6LRE3_9BACI|nr:HIT family protein [Terribacillus halophilus]SDC45335.1 Diadenosine tetraphosphate (Ap4A) hydrolase [Terribacillus halophilus]